MTLSDPWNPAQYERFKTEREQPFHDLVRLVNPRPSMRVVDLGCGTGELTLKLHQTLNASETLGIDSSASMLEKCGQFTGRGLHFSQGDLRQFVDDSKYDLVFSNAALQWVLEHEALIRGFFKSLRVGGQLAIQMPANQDHPSHQVARELASESPFRNHLIGPNPHGGMLTVEQYASILYRAGFQKQHVRLQVYAHLLDSREQVVEWVKGTLLTDYQRRLPEALFQTFVEQYRQKLMPKLEDSHPYLYAFKRILLWAEK